MHEYANSTIFVSFPAIIGTEFVIVDGKSSWQVRVDYRLSL